MGFWSDIKLGLAGTVDDASRLDDDVLDALGVADDSALRGAVNWNNTHVAARVYTTQTAVGLSPEQKENFYQAASRVEDDGALARANETAFDQTATMVGKVATEGLSTLKTLAIVAAAAGGLYLAWQLANAVKVAKVLV